MASNGKNDSSYRYRADVSPLQDALNSPSPLGNILDTYHRSHSEDGDGRFTLSPASRPSIGASDASKSEHSIFGEGGSVASSVVSTIVDGVHHTIAHWKILLFGQILSFFISLAGAAVEELDSQCHVSIPLTQTALAGVVLMLLGAFKMRGWCAGCSVRGRTKDAAGDSDEEEEFNCSESYDGGNQNTTQLNNEYDLSDGDEIEITDGWVSNDHPSSPMETSRRSSSRQPRSFCCGLQTIHGPWWQYFLAGLVAVEAHYLVFLAFKYTSFSFIFLVNALSIPSAMLFSKVLLGRSYHFNHILGGFVCICGICVSTIGDLKDNEIENIGSQSDINSVEHMRGDYIAITGAVLLGLDDVLSEMLIKNHGGVDELLFFKWFFGLGIAIPQLAILERDSLVALFENQGGEPCDVSTRFWLLGGYVIFQVLDLAGEVGFLGLSEAALLNLSLLTSDLWATAFTIFADGIAPSLFYYAALVLIVVGIVLYEAGPSPIHNATPSDIKITMYNTEADVTEHAENINKDGGLEMT